MGVLCKVDVPNSDTFLFATTLVKDEMHISVR